MGTRLEAARGWTFTVAAQRIGVSREYLADLMTVAEVAELVGISVYTAKEYASRGVLPGRRLGRSSRFIRPELEQALRRLPQGRVSG